MCLSTYTRQAAKLQTQLKSFNKNQLSTFTTSSVKFAENNLESEGLIITDACVKVSAFVLWCLKLDNYIKKNKYKKKSNWFESIGG